MRKSISLLRLIIQRGSHCNAGFLGRQRANHIQLTPISFLKHAAKHFPHTPAYLVTGEKMRSWSEVYGRIQNFASALQNLGIKEGDVVSIIAPNCISIFEAHFAVPGAGAVLHSINTRQDATTIAYQLEHSQCKALIVDSEYGAVIKQALQLIPENIERPLIIDSIDPEVEVPDKSALCGQGALLLEDLILSDIPSNNLEYPRDEWDAISLNYTSGTTGRPKGVLCHHRGAYLNAIGNMLEWSMRKFMSFY